MAILVLTEMTNAIWVADIALWLRRLVRAVRDDEDTGDPDLSRRIRSRERRSDTLGSMGILAAIWRKPGARQPNDTICNPLISLGPWRSAAA